MGFKKDKSFERDRKREENKFKYKGIIIFLFILVLGVTIYSSLFNTNFNEIKFTGKFLTSDVNSNDSMNFKANLSFDSLEIDGVFKEVSFTSLSKNELNIEKYKFNVNNSKITLKNYDGKII